MKKLFVSVVALLAAVSLSAQDVTAIYNEAAAAFGAKDFAGAAAKFEQVIEQGLDSEEAASLVATLHSSLLRFHPSASATPDGHHSRASHRRFRLHICVLVSLF